MDAATGEQGARARPAPRVERDELELYYQPKVELARRAVRGSRRWSAGTIRSAAWSRPRVHRVAEETGLIVRSANGSAQRLRQATDGHGLRACRSTSRRCSSSSATWSRWSPTPWPISGLEPDRLELEITESVLLQSTEAAMDAPPAQGSWACRSPSTISARATRPRLSQSFPFDKIKIDRAFVNALETRPTPMRSCAPWSASARASACRLRRRRRDRRAARLPEREGCDEVQGYCFGKPMPAPISSACTSCLVERQIDPRGRQRNSAYAPGLNRGERAPRQDDRSEP